MRTVLLLTHSADHFTVDRVADGLRARGARPVRVDTDRFPTALDLSVALPGGAVLRTPDGDTVHADAIAGVWARRVVPAALPEELDADLVDACVRESRAALDGFLGTLDAARWVDPLAAQLAASDKLRQLRLAERAGLVVPATLVTNEPARARAFWSAHAGRVVTKMLTAVTWSMGGDTAAVRTSRLAEADLAGLDGLRLAPMVFQEEVPKDGELRVAWVDGRAFAGRIDARDTAGAVDWRVAGVDTPWTPAELPGSVNNALDALMRALGLRFGAIDLIKRPDGTYVFLEVNPAGEWGMLERDLGLPIGDALARALTEPP